MHLVQGVTGTGKTTIALKFLDEGARAGEPTLYITLAQSQSHLERIARSHGWSVDGITIHELKPESITSRIAARQTVLATSDVELGELFHVLRELIETVKPRRAVVDSIGVLQMLAGSPQRYHREVVTLRQMFVEEHCTLLVLADHPAENETGDAPEAIFHPVSGCVIHLQQQARAFGDARRRLRVIKARGLPHNGGYHDFKITTGRIEVFPRLGAYGLEDRAAYEQISSGIGTLDHLLGGGLETGTSCLIVGESGTGKSSLATLYAASMGRAGERSAIFLFDERPETCIKRSEQMGIQLREHVTAGRLQIHQLDPGEIAPGEFAQHARQLVEQGTKLIIIDSLVGYFAAMGSADVLVTQLHELLTYLTRNDVLLIMCGSQQGFMSIGAQQAVDVSYLSDTIVALRFFELDGELRRAIAVVKKKHSSHVPTIREIALAGGRVEISEHELRQIHHLMVPEPVIRQRTGDGATS